MWLSRPGDVALWPGDVALWPGDVWLSPVIQATWEARAVGWLEMDTSLQVNGLTSGSALRASATLTGSDVALKSE
jgi:hypothetical protein